MWHYCIRSRKSRVFETAPFFVIVNSKRTGSKRSQIPVDIFAGIVSCLRNAKTSTLGGFFSQATSNFHFQLHSATFRPLNGCVCVCASFRKRRQTVAVIGKYVRRLTTFRCGWLADIRCPYAGLTASNICFVLSVHTQNTGNQFYKTKSRGSPNYTISYDSLTIILR